MYFCPQRTDVLATLYLETNLLCSFYGEPATFGGSIRLWVRTAACIKVNALTLCGTHYMYIKVQ